MAGDIQTNLQPAADLEEAAQQSVISHGSRFVGPNANMSSEAVKQDIRIGEALERSMNGKPTIPALLATLTKI